MTRPSPPVPSLRTERRLLRSGLAVVGGCDEVGRGALSGPATVAVVLVTAGTRTAPRGVRDSKLLTPAARWALVPRIQRWAAAYAVGHASPAEIDEWGIVAALRLAGHRALAALPALPEALLLDGSHDYLTPPEQPLLFDVPQVLDRVPPVLTMVRADVACASVAAASILAKTARDAIMVDLAAAHPEYRWDENKGYAAPEHLEALLRHGPTALHRRSWRLPGAAATAATAEVITSARAGVVEPSSGRRSDDTAAGRGDRRVGAARCRARDDGTLTTVAGTDDEGRETA